MTFAESLTAETPQTLFAEVPDWLVFNGAIALLITLLIALVYRRVL